MGKYADMFKKMVTTKAGGRRDQLGVGEHKLALYNYEVKQTPFRKQDILEARFVILESSLHEPGQIMNWAWHIGVDEFGFAQERATEFLDVIKECTGWEEGTDEIADAMIEDDQPGRGIVLFATVVLKLDKFGEPALSKEGKQFTEVTWTAEPGQTEEDRASRRAEIENMQPVIDASKREKSMASKQATKAAAPAVKAAPAAAPARKPLIGRK